MKFVYDKEKDKKLQEQRDISFEQVIECIAEGEILLDFEHPNKSKYKNQRIMVLKINNYPYCIPYIMDKEKIVLKTIYPDRRFKYLLEDKNEG